ncbi:hypothetical protein LPJ71_001937 [Coemansia sp. S17]|nr:hypothetical protein LPJ71_001937 [Coemansia sp. S17]
MFGDMSTYFSPNPTQQIGMMPPTPISAPFISHQEPAITVATAMLTGQTVANYGLGLPLQSPTSFFHHQHYSPLGTVSSAPPNMLELPHNVLRTQSSVDERHVSAGSYCHPTMAHTPTLVTTLGSGMASTARCSRTNNGATEHQYCRNSELAATERIAGAVGASSAGGSAVGSSTRSARLSCGVRSVLSTVAKNSDFCYEHVFSIHDRTDKQSLALRRPARSARALLPTPSGSAVACGGSSKKRTRKDAAPPAKRIKLAVKAEGDAVKAKPDAQERPYVCGHCGQRFSRNNDMKRHANIHTGEQPHKCPVCSRAFARADALARHTENGTTCKQAASVLARIVGQTLPLPHKTPSRL